jgi:hypothetical protein
MAFASMLNNAAVTSKSSSSPSDYFVDYELDEFGGFPDFKEAIANLKLCTLLRTFKRKGF